VKYTLGPDEISAALASYVMNKPHPTPTPDGTERRLEVTTEWTIITSGGNVCEIKSVSVEIQEKPPCASSKTSRK
jgi:hypothetical protein